MVADGGCYFSHGIQEVSYLWYQDVISLWEFALCSFAQKSYYERFAQVALNKRATVSDSLEKIREHCIFRMVLAVFPPFYVKEQIALVELRSFDLLEIATVRESLRSL